jgi:hypothetical protein
MSGQRAKLASSVESGHHVNVPFRNFAAACLLLAVNLSTLVAGPIWVAVGYGGRRISSRDGQIWENDQRWSDESKDDDNVLFNVAYGHPPKARAGKFVAVGGGAKTGHILWTEEGRRWTELPKLQGRVATIAFGRDRFVAGHDAELLYSEDGENFTAGQKLDWKGSVHARKSVFGDGEGGGMFVIIGDVDFFGEPARVSWRAATADGVNYAKADHHTPAARDIAFGGGHFVVVGPEGLIETSHDGFTWTRRPVDSKEEFNDVVWTGTMFVARGKLTWTSPDGIEWSSSPQTRIPGNIAWANQLTHSQNVRGIALAWGGSIFSSLDLREWKKLSVAPGPSFNAVAASD